MIEIARELDLSAADVYGTATFYSFLEYEKMGHEFQIKIFLGSGAYICGEETALFESMEGKRGEPRNKPPYPTSKGYMGKATVVNNVETLAHTFTIFKYGAKKFYDLGVQYSRGSKLFSVSGDTPKPGIYELELGMSLQDFVDEFGDGDTKAVQVGGASGFLVPRKRFDKTTIGYRGKLTGISLPTGGSMMIFNSSRSMYNVIDNYLEFFREESCGQCTPCRVGCQQLHSGIKAVKRGENPEVLKVYQDFLGEPLGEKSHHLLQRPCNLFFVSLLQFVLYLFWKGQKRCGRLNLHGLLPPLKYLPVI